MSKLTTEELLKILRNTHSVSDLNTYTSSLSGQKLYHSFSEYMNEYIRSKHLIESELILASQIQRTYAYQILNGNKNPGRDKVLSLCLAACMTYEETQRALTLADVGKLYAKRKRDSILIFALDHQLSVQQTNELLFEENEEILS